MSRLRNSRETGRPGVCAMSEDEAGPGPEVAVEVSARSCRVMAKNLDMFPKCNGKALCDLFPA